MEDTEMAVQVDSINPKLETSAHGEPLLTSQHGVKYFAGTGHAATVRNAFPILICIANFYSLKKPQCIWYQPFLIPSPDPISPHSITPSLLHLGSRHLPHFTALCYTHVCNSRRPKGWVC